MHACHLLFISASERKRLAETLAALPQTPLLTVGDQERFAEQGGMINLVLVEKKIRFEINIDAVERARLKLDPQLLNSAVKIHRRGKGH